MLRMRSLTVHTLATLPAICAAVASATVAEAQTTPDPLFLTAANGARSVKQKAHCAYGRLRGRLREMGMRSGRTGAPS